MRQVLNLKHEKFRLLLVGVAWILIGAGTLGYSYSPQWTVTSIGCLFVAAGVITVAYSVFPGKTHLYRWAFALSVGSCAGRAAVFLFWKSGSADVDKPSKLVVGAVLWLVFAWFTSIFWKKEVSEYNSHYEAYEARTKELRSN